MNPTVFFIFNAVRLFVTSGLFDRISSVVRNLIHAKMTNASKKEALKDWLSANKIEISGILLDGIIFATRLKYELGGANGK
jgi:hypothetical protein